MRTVVYRDEAVEMSEAHAEGLHSPPEIPREGCPERDRRELSSYPPRPKGDEKAAAIRELKLSINTALIVFGDENLALRRVLLTARGDIREALGEART